LKENRTTIAPIAGAVVILFGLHLLGWLIKLTRKAGIIVGAVLAGWLLLGSRLFRRASILVFVGFLYGGGNYLYLGFVIHAQATNDNYLFARRDAAQDLDLIALPHSQFDGLLVRRRGYQF